TRRRDASEEVGQGLVRNFNLEGVDVAAGLDGATHEATSFGCGGFGLTASLVREGSDTTPAPRAEQPPHQIDTMCAPHHAHAQVHRSDEPPPQRGSDATTPSQRVRLPGSRASTRRAMCCLYCLQAI